MLTLLHLLSAVALLVWGTHIVRTGVMRVYGALLWSSFFGHADQMVGLCTGGQLGGRAGQRFVLCG